MKNYWLDKKKVQEEKKSSEKPEDSKYGYHRPRRFNLMPKAFYYPKT